MRKATKKDKRLVIDLLTRSFQDNKSVNYIILNDHQYIRRIAALMDYSFEVCMRYGEVFLSEDNKGCALLLYPHQKKTSLFSIWLDVKLIFSAIGFSRIGKALARENKIKTIQPKLPMTYLWFIGVCPLYQHRHTGSALLQQVIDYSKGLGLPVYLETSTEFNLPWYKKHGFIIYDTLDLGYELHFLQYGPPK